MAGGLNLYGFANGDPVNYHDPFGLEAATLTGTALVATGVVATVTILALVDGEELGKAINDGLAAGRQLVSDVSSSVSGWFQKRREAGRNSGSSAPGQTAGGRATDAQGNALGPSGRPQINQVDHPTKKRARDAARNEGQGAPVNHPSPVRGQPHYHPTDRSGNKKPTSTHHNYPT